jgi:hypothetical protein
MSAQGRGADTGGEALILFRAALVSDLELAPCRVQLSWARHAVAALAVRSAARARCMDRGHAHERSGQPSCTAGRGHGHEALIFGGSAVALATAAGVWLIGPGLVSISVLPLGKARAPARPCAMASDLDARC